MEKSNTIKSTSPNGDLNMNILEKEEILISNSQSSSNVYSWGFGKYGQLGKRFNNFCVIPQQLDDVKKEVITEIFCGESHSMLLTAAPKLFCFGKNFNGQLGLGQSDSINNQYVNFPELNLISCQHKIKKVSCGGDHTILLTEENKVITFGLNVFGQLSIEGNMTSKSIPTILNNENEDDILYKVLDKDEYVIDIAAGAQHSLILTNKNRILSCGSNMYSGLGQFKKEETTSSTKDFDIDDLMIYSCSIFKEIDYKINFNHSISYIRAGFYHSCCVVDSNRIIVFGEGEILKYPQPTEIGCIQNLKNVKVGQDCLLFYTDTEIFVLGNNSKGQIGLGSINFVEKPTKLFIPCIKLVNSDKLENKGIIRTDEYLAPTKIIQADLGYEFGIVIVEFSAIDKLKADIFIEYPDFSVSISDLPIKLTLGFGSNEFGQLSLDNKIFVNTPSILPRLNLFKAIACGGHHSLGIYNNLITEGFNTISSSKQEPRPITKSSSMPTLDKISINKQSDNILKRHNSNKNLNKIQITENSIITEMRNLLLKAQLSSTLKNDNLFIEEKIKLLGEIKKKTDELEEKYKKNDKKIKELEQIEKELLSKLQDKKENKEEKGFKNSFEIGKDEIELLSEIGRGTYGVVFKAKWRKGVVSAKVIKEDMLVNEESIKNFHDECLFMKNLRHPNILLFMGAGTKGPEFFIITEYCENGNLFQLLHNNKSLPISWEEKRRLALEVAYGMNYLHSFKPPILHRDLKSMNILLNRFWQVKIADFGNTKFYNKFYMTRQKGTFQWMAPEVILNTVYSEKADVFSFGIIMSELMSRVPPYFGVDKKKVAQQVAQNANFRPQIPKNCPKDWADLMKRCWDHNASKRPTYSEIIEALIKAKL